MSSGDPNVPESNADSTPSVTNETPVATGSENPASAETPSPETDIVPEPSETTQDASQSTASDLSAGPATSAPTIARGAGPLAARGLGVAKPASPQMQALRTHQPRGESKKSQGPRDHSQSSGKGHSQSSGKGHSQSSGKGHSQSSGKGQGSSSKAAKPFRPHGTPSGIAGETTPETTSPTPTATAEEAAVKEPAAGHKGRVSLPNLRQPLGDDLMAELEAQLAATDVGALLSSPPGLEKSIELEEGQRIRAKVLKSDDEFVFFSLGGPNEGTVSILQFEETPEDGAMIDVVVRGFNREDGLYNLVVPGQAMDVSDWEDLEEGSVVEAHITAANTGGLEATVGSIRGFIPISQIAQYRVEDAAEFVGQRMLCVVTECNPRRKNLVLSRRAVLEREREEQRQEQLAKIEPGMTIEGTVRSIKDFGAFVDLGGLDGMIHISKLSWDNVKSPSDVLEVGQKVKVKVEKIDKQTGKISLSYRDLLENPWDTAEASFPIGSVVTGTVSRVANFGAFVRLGAGIEGLVHISEIANHRVTNVGSFLTEGAEVQVKILAFERESQRISLSIKQAVSKAVDGEKAEEEPTDEPPREPAVRRTTSGPLKGGVGSDSGGGLFGLKW